MVLVEEAKDGALHDRSVHVMIRIYGCWLEWRSQLVRPFVRTVLDRHVLGGRLSSSDIAGGLLPVGPAGIPFPVGPVDPAGPYIAGGLAGWPRWDVVPVFL